MPESARCTRRCVYYRARWSTANPYWGLRASFSQHNIVGANGAILLGFGRLWKATAAEINPSSQYSRSRSTEDSRYPDGVARLSLLRTCPIFHPAWEFVNRAPFRGHPCRLIWPVPLDLWCRDWARRLALWSVPQDNHEGARATEAAQFRSPQQKT